MKVKLFTLYLYHALAWAGGMNVINSHNQTVQPDEGLMRYLEHECGISEEEVHLFRNRVFHQFLSRRVDFLYERCEHVFSLIADCETEKLIAWFTKYPNLNLYRDYIQF